MTNLQLLSPAGHGEHQRRNRHCAQVLQIGQRVEISAQGGWTEAAQYALPEGQTLEQECRQAFDNVGHALASVGAAWSDVVHVNSYHVPAAEGIGAGVAATSALLREHLPECPPVWTCIGVTGLAAGPSARVELRVTAILDGRPAVHFNEGFGRILRDQFHFGQSVSIDDPDGHRVEMSGQGGWNDAFEFPATVEEEYRQAFANVATVLALEGATWSDVVHVHSYHKVAPGKGGAIVTGQPAAAWMRDGFQNHMPAHQPLWTCVGTTGLGDDRMNVEIRVTARRNATTPTAFIVTDGTGEILHREHAMSQVARMGRRIEISGQGGWNDALQCPQELHAQLCMAMENVGKALAAAGGAWRDVVQVHSYHVPSSAHGSVEHEASILSRLLPAFMPDHAPLWTCIGVPALGEASMRVEIRVVAYLPN